MPVFDIFAHGRGGGFSARDAKSGRRSREGGRAHLFGVLAFDDGLDDRLGGVLGGGSLDGLRVARGQTASAIVRISIDYASRKRASNWP